MNSELEAIMKRRRRRADGYQSPGRNKSTSGDEGDSKTGGRKGKGSRRKNTLEKIKTISKRHLTDEDSGTIGEVFSIETEDQKPAENLKYKTTGLTDDEYSSSEDEAALDQNGEIPDLSPEDVASLETDNSPSFLQDTDDDPNWNLPVGTDAVLPPPTDDQDFTNFQPDFDATFPSESLDEDEEPEYEPPQFEDYEPPTFDVSAFPQTIEPIDLSPLENPPIRPPPEIRLSPETYLTNLSSCAPIINPITGNLIVCRMRKHTLVLHEMDVHHCMEVLSTPILNGDMQRKIHATYGLSAIGITQVVRLAAGLHQSQGVSRVRLAALVDFDVLSPSGNRKVQTCLAVWQWGYGPHRPVALQSLVSPPNHADFSYQSNSFLMADGLVFLSGYARSKGPCVFIARPTMKDTWSANFLNASQQLSVTCMAVTPHAHRKHKFLGIGMNDGTLSVWTYEHSIDRKQGKEDSMVILPLCRLEGSKFIGQQIPTRLSGDDELTTKKIPEEEQEVRFCTHLEWKSPDSSYSSLLLLAAAFTDGLAIFHVSLPMLVDTTPPEDLSELGKESSKGSGIIRPLPTPKNSMTLEKTIALNPFVATRWSIHMDRCEVSWVDLGPHMQPTLAIWLEKAEVSAACLLGVIDLPPMGSSEALKPFRVLVEHFLPYSIGGLLNTCALGSIWCYGNGSIETLTPDLSNDGSFFISLRSPTTSVPHGLDSAGYVALPDTVGDPEGVLHIFSVVQCGRQLCPELPSLTPNATCLDWTTPVLRHWLCRTRVGDTKGDQEMIDEDTETGGSSGRLICDLSFTGLTPVRIVRCKGSPICAVLFQPSLGNSQGISVDPISFTLVDTTDGSILDTRDGRDIVFLPMDNQGCERALVLGQDGTIMYMLRRQNTDDISIVSFEEGPPFRPLLGFDAGDNYIECRRLLAVSEKGKQGLVLAGTRVSDSQVCLVAGNFSEPDESSLGGWTRMIPNMKDGYVLWCKPGEEILTLSELPQYEEGRRCIAVATQSRVALLSNAMIIRSEANVMLSSISLASIGSHCVCFCSRDFKVRYLCCLDGKFAQGIIATLPTPRYGHSPYMLMAMRPERFLYFKYHAGTRMVERGEKEDSVALPTALTRPAMLLEPMVANALCEADNPGESTILLRAVVERFGRKVGAFPHGDDEGIGSGGTGLTPQVLELFSAYGHKHPSSWLLTGNSRFDRNANSKVLPSWMPIANKAFAAINSDANLHIVATGDQYFSEYVKSPDTNMAATLPRQSDPSSIFCRELAVKAMMNGDVAGALKFLDLAGSESSDSAILQLVLAAQSDPFADVTPALKALSGFGEEGYGRSSSFNHSSASLAALALDLRTRSQNGTLKLCNGEFEKMNDAISRRYIRQLAPSIQRSHRSNRVRHRLIGEEAVDKAVTRKQETKDPDKLWSTACNESRHIWNEGPFKDKENLLLLDRMEEWLGRRRPTILGKEGAEMALERGEKTLADILNRADYDDDSFGAHSEEGTIDNKGGWVDGIGEGRTDDDMLSAYFRMSDGADEDSAWRAEGLADLSKHKNKITIVDLGNTRLEETNSSVDEGEAGKVKLLYDIVFDEHHIGDAPSGFYIQADRGSSLDVGMLHAAARDSRKRCTLEFWYHLPAADDVTEEIILARRSISSNTDEVSKLCIATDREFALWEVAVKPTGELEFRTCGGTQLSSLEGDDDDFGGGDMMGDFGDDDGSVADVNNSLVNWARKDGSGGGWNHLAITFSSRHQDDITDCLVTIFMKGIRVAATIATIDNIPGTEDDFIPNNSNIDDAMRKSVLIFCIKPVTGLRFTELRVWSCERSEDDIKMMMYEYLRAAETKQKFKVKIRSKQRADAIAEKSPKKTRFGLAPPLMSGGGRLPPPPGGGTKRALLAPPPTDTVKADDGFSPPTRNWLNDKQTESAPAAMGDAFGGFPNMEPVVPSKRGGVKGRQSYKMQMEDFGMPPPPVKLKSPPGSQDSTFDSAFDPSANFFPDLSAQPMPLQSDRNQPPTQVQLHPFDQRSNESGSFGTKDSAKGRVDIWKSGIPLSKQVRSSAAAALVRGPPATRHFGGNRGGLATSVEHDRTVNGSVGVGSIAICGAEKTVVYKQDRVPPGKTYPIGASGAIISDEMDKEGSEYLCCFLAKDKRMVVFELSTKTVVVELQMTTKLNFWRYLPPQAHGHTLVFMLITPVGGFHWMPLDESPRPRQVWKRGSDLQGKKIVTYEEGGSNGLVGPLARSTVALLLVSTASTGTPMEAWLMPICGDSRAVCVSHNVLGTALLRPYVFHEAFLPLLVTADKMNEKDIILEVAPLVEHIGGSSLGVGDVITCAIIDQREVRKINLQPPTLAMGTWPEVFVCCHENMIVAAIRRKGLLVAYEFKEGDLLLIRQETVGHYIVDAAIRGGVDCDEVEVVLLLSDTENTRDGRAVSITIEFSQVSSRGSM